MIGSGPGAADDPRADDGRALATDIAALHDYADGVAAAAGELPAGDDGLRARVVAAATRVGRSAREPITVGVVGQYSSGKSLLLGLLLGKPDLLPVADRPLTANVTALTLTDSPPGSRTACTTAQVDYLTEAELTQLVEHMLDELAARTTRAGLDPEPLRAVRATRPPARFWSALERWCRAEAWPRGELRLNLLVAELMALRAAVAAAPALLGWTTAVRPDVVDAALRLPAPDAGADPRAFPQPVAPPATVNQRGGPGGFDGPDAAQLRATLPLVRRVTLGVAVPSDVWDLSALRGGNEMVLLDFPGLGAKGTGVRDRWLSRRELQDVTTIVVVINGQAGGSDVPTEFPLMMGREAAQLRDRVLAVVGRFDQLPDYLRPELYARDAGGPPVTDRALTDDPLRTVMSDARDLVGLGHDDRIAFFSAMVGLHGLDGQYPARPDGFAAARRLDEHGPRAREQADRWGGVAARLAADDLSSVLQVPLRELARDGGVAHLRALLERHVRAHGLRLRHDDLVDDVDRLARDVGRLVAAAEDELGASAVAARAAARQPVESLLTDVRVALQELQERAADDLADPDRFLVGPDRTLAAAVAGQAVAEVFAWPEWDRLFDAVEDRIVAVSTGDEIEIDIPGLSGPTTELPARTAEFRTRFERAVEECAQRSEALAWAAFDAWVRRQNDGLAALRESTRQVVDDDARRRVTDALGRDDPYTRALDLAVDLVWLSRTVRKYVPGYLKRHRELARPAVFPLPDDSWFAWHPEIPHDVRRAMDAILSRHQVQLARLRRELVNGVAAAVLARLGVVQLGMAEGTRRALAQPKALVDDRVPFVDALVGESGGPGDDPLATLRALTPPAVRRTGRV